jgi:predicted DNA-binding transcriptional regulator AlpA
MTRRRVIRDWPPFLSRHNAAAALDMSLAEFERAMLKGELPMPVMTAAGERWRLSDIENAYGVADEKDWRDKSRLYGGRNARAA